MLCMANSSSGKNTVLVVAQRLLQHTCDVLSVPVCVLMGKGETGHFGAQG